jgi:hypothetical protein
MQTKEVAIQVVNYYAHFTKHKKQLNYWGESKNTKQRAVDFTALEKTIIPVMI